MISTEEGNENSKANPEEVEQAVSGVLGNCWSCRREDVVLGGVVWGLRKEGYIE